MSGSDECPVCGAGLTGDQRCPVCRWPAEKPTARLEQWYVGADDLLYGYVYGHKNPQLKDGSFIFTSRVVVYDKANNRAVTLNTNYILGEPAE